MLSPEELKAIRYRAEKATPGPWDEENSPFIWAGLPVQPSRTVSIKQISADMELIAHAAMDIPALLAHIDELTGQLEAGCNGCAHEGLYENELQHGYNCPCIQCKRRCADHYCGLQKPQEATNNPPHDCDTCVHKTQGILSHYCSECGFDDTDNWEPQEPDKPLYEPNGEIQTC